MDPLTMLRGLATAIEMAEAAKITLGNASAETAALEDRKATLTADLATLQAQIAQAQRDKALADEGLQAAMRVKEERLDYATREGESKIAALQAEHEAWRVKVEAAQKEYERIKALFV